MRPYGFNSHQQAGHYNNGSTKRTKFHRARRSYKAGAPSKTKRANRRAWKKSERSASKAAIFSWRREYCAQGDGLNGIRMLDALLDKATGVKKHKRIGANMNTYRKFAGFCLKLFMGAIMALTYILEDMVQA